MPCWVYSHLIFENFRLTCSLSVVPPWLASTASCDASRTSLSSLRMFVTDSMTLSASERISAATSVLGRVLTGTTAGALVEQLGYFNFYMLTTILALPGVVLFWWMSRAGLIDRSVGSAGIEGPGDARDGASA